MVLFRLWFPPTDQNLYLGFIGNSKLCVGESGNSFVSVMEWRPVLGPHDLK